MNNLSTKEKWDLILQYKSLMYYILNKFNIKQEDKDDIVYEIGIPAFLKAIETYDESKALLTTYIKKVLYNAYYNYIKHIYNINNELIIDSFDNENYTHCKNMIQYNKDTLEIKDYILNKVIPILYTLPPDQKKVLYYRFFQDISYEDIGKKMKISKQWSNTLARKALDEIRSKLKLQKGKK